MKVLALTGGVGGAKLAVGLCQRLSDGELTCLVNTADDFTYMGLKVCPDLDSLMYALAGENNTETGWGRRGETWQMKGALQALGVDAWFAIGDLDAATHILRTDRLRAGDSLTEVTGNLYAALGIGCRALPMTESEVATKVHTADGLLDFQDYFVRKQASVAVEAISFAGIEAAAPNPEAMALLQSALDLIVMCPSNPYLSMDPILQLPNVAAALTDSAAPVVAVSPLIGGGAVKGPAAKIMSELGLEASAVGVARYYTDTYPGLLSAFVLDEQDARLAADIEALGVDCLVCRTLMQTDADKHDLAGVILDNFAVAAGGAADDTSSLA